nr:integrase, catalytic region, zinc finger, CCHC-type, peptidase aspartic, catalytic [Tanacetum cinerariifolium]
MIPEPGYANREVNVTETFHLKTDDELSDKELMQIEADDQAIQTILLGNPAGYNDVIRNQVIQNAVQNPRVQNIRNHNGLIGVQGNGNQNQIGNGNLVAARTEGNAARQNENQIRCYNCRGKEDSGIQLQAEEYDLMAAAADLDEIEEVNANYILMANLQQASTSGTQTDSVPFYDTDGSAEVHENCDNNEIFNMFTQEDQYTEILDPIPESHQVPQNDNVVISEDTSVEQGVFVPQKALSRKESYFSNNSKMANVSKSFLIPNEDLSDDTTPSVARKFLNEVKSTIVTLQRVVKQRMTIETHNWASSAHQELHNIEAAKFVGDFKSLTNEADASLVKHKALELEIKRLLKAVVSQDIMIIVQNESVVDTSDLQTKLKCMKECFENCIIKKEAEYAKLWNDWYKKCDECKYDKISYDKAYKDMQQKIKQLQAQLGDLKGKGKDTSSVSDTKNLLFQKLENENVELEFQVLNYARENAHLKATYKNLFDSISVSSAQTKTIITSLQNELQSNIYKNAKLRTQLFKKIFDQKDNTQNTSENTKFAKQPIVENLHKIGKTNALSKPVTSNSVSTPQESKDMNNDKVIAPGIFRINPSKTSREEKHVPNTVSVSNRTKLIAVSQPPVITKKDVNSDLNGLSSIGVDNTKTRRPHPRSNTKHDRVLSASKSSQSKNKEAEVEEHHRNLLLSKNNKHISSACNNIQIDSPDKESKGKGYQPKVSKPKKVGTRESLATPKPRKSRLILRWSPTGRLFNQEGKLVDSSESKSKSDCFIGNLKLLINFVWMFMRTVRFGNDHVAAIQGFGDLQWGNILITRVYFVEGLGHNLFSIGQFCDSDLEVAFRRDACFVRNLDGVDLLKGDRSTNLYTINLHEMASASPIYLMARASSTKSWLWHQRLSHLNFDTINDLARNDLVAGLPKFKYHKEHLCPSCEQGKSKRVSHPPKPIPNSRQRLHLLHMDLCGPMRIASINGKRYVLVIMDDYSHYTWVHFLRSKDEAPEEIIKFLKKITAIVTACFTQNRSIIHHRFNKTPYELINDRKPDILFLHVFGALCYPKNDREDIGKLGAKGDIGFFIGYSTDSCAYRVYNRRTKKIMETMNVSFDELSTMAFEQCSSKPGLQSMISGHISSGLDLTYAPLTITMQQPSEGELDLLFEALYDDYIGGQPSATARTVSPAQEP